MKDQMQKQMERIAYTTYCEDFNLKPEWLDKTVRDRGKMYTITGLNIRSKKFPVTTKEGPSFNADYVRGLMTGDMATIEKERAAKREKEYQQARKNYPTYCIGYDLEKSWLDKTFVDRFTTYRIDGLRLSSRSYPVQARRTTDNKVMFFRTGYIAELMNKSKKAKAKAAAAAA